MVVLLLREERRTEQAKNVLAVGVPLVFCSFRATTALHLLSCRFLWTGACLAPLRCSLLHHCMRILPLYNQDRRFW